MTSFAFRILDPASCPRPAFCIYLIAGLVAVCPLLTEAASILNSAESFAVLGASTVTNTGPTIVDGNLGVSPGTAVTGFPPGSVVNGSIYTGANAVALQAHADTVTAYGILAGETAGTNLTGQDLGGLTLTPGVLILQPS